MNKRGEFRRVLRSLRRSCTIFRGTLWLLASGGVALVATGASGSTSHDAICDQAAHLAANNSNVPVDVLMAITRTETGRKRNGRISPWPWTVNMEGKGHWFDTEDAARAFVYKEYKRGARSFDVGCFQINYRWHGQEFASIDEMFDPVLNARYAARFLSDLHREMGSWSTAAGAFHSRTESLATKYRARFDRFRLAVADAPPPQPFNQMGQTPKKRDSAARYPLFVEGASSGTMGSLMPTNAPTQTRFIPQTGVSSLFMRSMPVDGNQGADRG